MPFNGGGSFSPPGASFPAVANTLIEATKFNAVINDICTNGLSNVITKDGQTTITANIPMSGFKFTGLAAGTANGDSLRYEQLGIGTARQVLNTNSGATATAWRDQITLGTEQVTTSGTSIDFTSIPSKVKRITIMFNAVSTNGTDNWLIQIGDAGGIENADYVGGGGNFTSAAQAAASSTAGFLINNSSASSGLTGSIVLDLEDAAQFTWACRGVLNDNSAPAMLFVAGIKSLSAELDRVRLTTTGGTDAFDAGAINISYE